MKPTLEGSDRVLIVEGYSDLRFLAELLESMHLGASERPGAKPIYIHEMHGKSDVQDKIEVIISPGLLAQKSAIAVVVDADANPAGTRASLEQVLSKVCGAAVPAAGGWVQSRSHAKVGFHVVPGGARDEVGEVETLVWNAWSKTTENVTVMVCIESYISCMAAAGLKPKSPDKARVGALLSIRNDDDPRLGPGAQSGVFDLASPGFADLRSFLDGFRGM